ncbi:MAG: (Fe-S)-binding protein [Chloroflexota bacterium]
MLLTGYTVKMQFPECNHLAERANALAELSDDISEVFPYLNAVMSGARFNPAGRSLALQYQGHRVVLRPRQAAISNVENEDEARRLLDWLVEVINRTWEQRADIEPRHDTARQPGLIEIYRMLPGSNCRACGEATCMAFAARLVRGEANLGLCEPLSSPDARQRHDRLKDLLLPTGGSN